MITIRNREVRIDAIHLDLTDARCCIEARAVDPFDGTERQHRVSFAGGEVGQACAAIGQRSIATGGQFKEYVMNLAVVLLQARFRE